jgi:alpha-L-rhamnosidase
MITESAEAFMKYFKYLDSRKDENGLLNFGLGDWCHVGRHSPETMPKAPLIVTDSIISMDLANKSAVMFDAVGNLEYKLFAEDFAQKLREAIRENLIDFSSMTVLGECQSCQAMGLFYGIFEPQEEKQAFEKLLDFIRDADEHIDVGVLGGRVIFHVLSKYGYSDLAFKMITRPDYPSYGNWIERGATTLWENFDPDFVDSPNHHFWGDISAWFIKTLGGIQVNPTFHNLNELIIKPHFIKELDFVKATHIMPQGEVSVNWTRSGNNIEVIIKLPKNVKAEFIAENKSVLLTEGEHTYQFICA